MIKKLELAAQCGVVVVAYYLAAVFGLSLAFEQANTSPVWPPTGIALSALLLRGIHLWPGVALGAFLVNVQTDVSFLSSALIAIGNTLEAVVGWWLLSKFSSRYPFDTISNVAKFALIITIATTVSATVGVTTLYLSNTIDANAYPLLWTTWWLGDLVGGIVVTPFLLTWLRDDFSLWKKLFSQEPIYLFIIGFFSISVSFTDWFSFSGHNYPVAFIYLPVSIWIGYRLGHLGSTFFIIVLSGFAIYATLDGLGPFVRTSENESLLLLQGFMGVMMISTLALVASIEESKKANQKLADNEETLRQIVSQQTGDLETAAKQLKLAENVFRESDQAIVIADKEHKILRINPSFTKITGFSQDEVISRPIDILKSFKHSEEFYRNIRNQLLERGNWQGEIWEKKKNGEIYPTWQTVSAVRNSQHQVIQFISIFSDISEQKTAEEKIYHLAHYDVVTGLRNRTAFHDQLEKAIAYADRSRHQLAILYLDLDNFKLINDASGHPVGDQLLKHVADRMQESIREEDTVARLGGDEFVILLVELSAVNDAAMVADKILKEIAKPILLENTEVVVTGSIGISTYPIDGADADTLLKNADSAMYRAKAKGKNNNQFFTAEMNALAQERLALENDMRKALENNEFVLHFQPQFDINTKDIIGCEALVRWQHPERGLIQPNQFIPIAEESGLIKPLGHLVLLQACQARRRWSELGIPNFRVAVNISCRQFLSQQLITDIQDVLSYCQTSAELLELELTESTIMENVEENIKTLQKLHDMGIILSVDDFGTGYSSMAYLKRFPIDKLKIDRSFVRDIATDPDDAAIVEATTLLAHSLNLTVIAEGVEAVEQLDFLKQVGCDEVQGFYFSKPLQNDEFVRFVNVHVPVPLVLQS
ncbi:MAG: EAL domain-containing protein [Kangiellaceae bacterium]|nr:EAL domain-containing protein [Kangiellaceae bacterium]